jgi:formate dehydrogenase assembly factor FdhD
MQEERDVHVRDSLSQHAGKQHEEVVMNDDDVARFVDLDDLVGEFLVHPIVIGPLNTFASAVGRLMLLVVEEGVEIVLSISSPAGLVLEKDTLRSGLRFIGEPNRVGADGFVV